MTICERVNFRPLVRRLAMTSSDSQERVIEHYNAEAESYGSRYDPKGLLDRERYSANYFRLQLIIKRLTECRARRLYEVGVGDGVALSRLAAEGFAVAGCDIAPAMVERARAHFAASGLDAELCQLGDIENLDTVLRRVPASGFDAVIAAGVLPHVGDARRTLTNMGTLLAPGGRVMVEFRNKLFALFTFNRFTHDFILDDLLAGLDPKLKQAVAEDLALRCALDQPPPRLVRPDGMPDYDAIPAHYHNPFELPELFASAGLRLLKVHWYHFHAVPPMIEARVGREEFRRASMAMEGRTDDWRGHFLCSAGVAEAQRAT
jgi:2-polyprenyl-3-methyl-5-hydroxy-6-metoxy-1,4-benzoquinol methylase